jgi:hypothetical protein
MKIHMRFDAFIQLLLCMGSIDHALEGAQQLAALLKAGLAQLGQADVDLLSAAAEET